MPNSQVVLFCKPALGTTIRHIIEQREKKIANNDLNESYAQSFYLSKFSEGKTNSFVTSRVKYIISLTLKKVKR